MIEEERRDVIVVDEEQDVRLLLLEPGLNRPIGLENGCPDGVVLLLPVEGEADRRRVRACNRADDPGQTGLLQVASPQRATHPTDIGASCPQTAMPQRRLNGR